MSFLPSVIHICPRIVDGIIVFPLILLDSRDSGGRGAIVADMIDGGAIMFEVGDDGDASPLIVAKGIVDLDVRFILSRVMLPLTLVVLFRFNFIFGSLRRLLYKRD